MPNVCVPGILGAALLLAVIFGSMGFLLNGPQSWAQLILQSLGSTIGAYGAANMHKAEAEGCVCHRFLRIGLGSVAGTACSAVAFSGDLDLAGFVTSAMLTSLGGVLVALMTDPEYTLGQLLETLLQKPP
eukprot:symbB.v1.2.024565.t1/scaffold2335.1/size81964/3